MGGAESHDNDGGSWVTEVHIDNQTPLQIERVEKNIEGKMQYWQLHDGKINANKDERGRDIPKVVAPWETETFVVSGRKATDVGPKGSAFFQIGRQKNTSLTLKWDNGRFVKFKGRAEMTGPGASRFIVTCDVEDNPYHLTFHIHCIDVAVTYIKVTEATKKDETEPGFFERWLRNLATNIVNDIKDELPDRCGTDAAIDAFTIPALKMNADLTIGRKSNNKCSWDGEYAEWVNKDGREGRFIGK